MGSYPILQPPPPPNPITIALQGTEDKVQKTETRRNPVCKNAFLQEAVWAAWAWLKGNTFCPGLYKPKAFLPLPGPLSPLRVKPEDAVFPIYPPPPNPVLWASLCTHHPHDLEESRWKRILFSFFFSMNLFRNSGGTVIQDKQATVSPLRVWGRLYLKELKISTQSWHQKDYFVCPHTQHQEDWWHPNIDLSVSGKEDKTLSEGERIEKSQLEWIWLQTLGTPPGPSPCALLGASLHLTPLSLQSPLPQG